MVNFTKITTQSPITNFLSNILVKTFQISRFVNFIDIGSRKSSRDSSDGEILAKVVDFKVQAEVEFL